MKDSKINELKSVLPEKKDEWLASELTSEEKTSKDADIKGKYITLSSSLIFI